MYTEAVIEANSSEISNLVLANHFLCLAEETDQTGDRTLAKHFLQIALDLFDCGPDGA